MRVVAPLPGLILLIACGGEPPRTHPEGTEYVADGDSQLAWTQHAPTPADIARYRYAVYVNGIPQPLQSPNCWTAASSDLYDCSAPLPQLSPGRYTLELATVIEDHGFIVQSAPSAALVVIVVGSPPRGAPLETQPAEGIPRLRAEVVARGLTRPVALAFLPEGGFLVAQRNGTVKLVSPNRGAIATALSGPSLGEAGEVVVNELILHPRFAGNRFVFLVYTVVNGSSASARIVRFREMGGTLGDPMLVAAGLDVSPDHLSVAAAFGPEGHLYVATAPSAGISRHATIFQQLTDDGVIPLGQPSAAAPVTIDAEYPVGIGHNPITGRLWVVHRLGSWDATTGNQVEQLYIPTAMGADLYTGSAFPAFRHALFVASGEGRHIDWQQFDPARRIWFRRGLLFVGTFGRLSTVREGPDGFLYIGTDNTLDGAQPPQDDILRIVPARGRQKSVPR